MMDDDNLMDVNFTDLDLNQEPTDPLSIGVSELGFFHDSETSGAGIEERIRHLEAVNARQSQRQRWRQARSTEIGYNFGEIMGANPGGGNSIGLTERTQEKGKGCKRDSSHLVAKALEMDSEVKKTDKEGGSFYDCNICLDLANEPILTCCGHLFCWACFYQVSYIDSTSKECPVCKGEVSDSTVIPIYGNGSGERVTESESGMKIPPRPKARRVESIRQQRVSQGLSHVPVAEALRRIRISIGAMGGPAPEQDGRTGEGQNAEGGTGRRLRIHQVSRVLSESAASLSSLSNALSSAERLVEDLESVITNRLARTDSITPMHSINEVLDAIGDTNVNPAVAATHTPATATATDVSGSVLRIRTLRSSGETTLPIPPTTFTQRRRSSISRPAPDVDNRDIREYRRRRLN